MVFRSVRIHHSILDDIGKNFSDISRQRRYIVAPPPNCHSRDVERARRSAVSAKSEFKGRFMLSTGQPTLESR